MFVIKKMSKKWGNGTTIFIEKLKETESSYSFCLLLEVLSINFPEKLIKSYLIEI